MVQSQSPSVESKYEIPLHSLEQNHNLDMYVTEIIQINKTGNNSNNLYHYYLQGTFINTFI